MRWETAPSTILNGRASGLARTDRPPCSRHPDLFFAEDPVRLEFAKTLCENCAARDTCLAGALARREPVGVWGGQIFDRGRVIEHKRRRGRPPNPASRARRNEPAAVRTAVVCDLAQVG
jgi:WhiB family transcriptional regulator, redox-sensing transcriptional regulator